MPRVGGVGGPSQQIFFSLCSLHALVVAFSACMEEKKTFANLNSEGAAHLSNRWLPAYVYTSPFFSLNDSVMVV